MCNKAVDAKKPYDMTMMSLTCRSKMSLRGQSTSLYLLEKLRFQQDLFAPPQARLKRRMAHS